MFGNYRCCFTKCRISFIKGRTLFLSAFENSPAKRNQNIDVIRPRRAIMYVPGHDRRKIDKLQTFYVDCAVLDCEDGVAVNKKDEARTNICEISEHFDFGRTEFSIRINSIDSGLAEDDLKAILSCKRLPDSLMVPKVESIDHFRWINDKLKENLSSRETKLNLIIFIESAKSVLDLKSICEKGIELSKCGSFKLEGLVFGSDDFCADIGATRTEEASEVLTARQLIVLAAKAFKLQAIDMVHINYKDESGLLKSCENGARMGFTGKQVIHPAQVPIVQSSFSPSPEKVAWAEELISLFEKHQNEGKGAFTFKGAMIDKPLLLQAEYIVKMSRLLNE